MNVTVCVHMYTHPFVPAQWRVCGYEGEEVTSSNRQEQSRSVFIDVGFNSMSSIRLDDENKGIKKIIFLINRLSHFSSKYSKHYLVQASWL